MKWAYWLLWASARSGHTDAFDNQQFAPVYQIILINCVRECFLPRIRKKNTLQGGEHDFIDHISKVTS